MTRPYTPQTHSHPVVEIKPEDITTIPGARRYLDSLVNFEHTRPHQVNQRELKLDRMRRLLKELGDPQESLRCVHVAGSKGKGSVCEMLAAALAGCGYVSGVYTSPHLVDVRERFRIDGPAGPKKISMRDFPKYVARTAEAAAALPKKLGPITFFEATTALALTYFARRAVDVAIIEVGLGGRLDSTNVITPEVACVTHLQLEHTQILGDTIDQIAREKAGILKPGVPAITMPQEPAAIDAIVEVAERVGCELRVLTNTMANEPPPESATSLGYSARFEHDHEHGQHTRISLNTPRVCYEHIPVPLKGAHQALNGALVLALLDALSERGFDLPEIKVVDGLGTTRGRGKLELVHEAPRIMIDGAHNPASIAALVKAIGACVPADSVAVVFGCASDKNIDEMLTEIGRGADKIVFTRSQASPRAADPATLAARYTELTNKDAQTEPTVKEAINAAARAVGRDDLILVTGSFYIAGEAKKLLKDKQKQARTQI